MRNHYTMAVNFFLKPMGEELHPNIIIHKKQILFAAKYAYFAKQHSYYIINYKKVNQITLFCVYFK